MDTKIEQASSLVQALSRNLRRLRTERGLSLNDLAARSGVAKATITNLEAGKGNPTVETMCALSVALNVSYGALLAEGEPDIYRIVRADEGAVVVGEPDDPRANGSTEGVRLLDRIGRRATVEIYELTFPAGSRRDAAPHNPGVIEHILVTDGRLLVGPMDQTAELGTGDLIRFPGDLPHLYVALDGPARATLVMDYPAELSDGLALSVPLDVLLNRS
jgi:transcriptional regulator with XRE-family HTH domain